MGPLLWRTSTHLDETVHPTLVGLVPVVAARPLSLACKPGGHHVTRPLQHTLGQSLFKPGAISLASSPNRDRHPSKMTPAPGRGKETTYTSQTGHSSGLGTYRWADYRPCPLMKVSQETTQGKCPAIWCYYISSKCLF